MRVVAQLINNDRQLSNQEIVQAVRRENRADPRDQLIVLLRTPLSEQEQATLPSLSMIHE